MKNITILLAALLISACTSVSKPEVSEDISEFEEILSEDKKVSCLTSADRSLQKIDSYHQKLDEIEKSLGTITEDVSPNDVITIIKDIEFYSQLGASEAQALNGHYCVKETHPGVISYANKMLEFFRRTNAAAKASILKLTNESI